MYMRMCLQRGCTKWRLSEASLHSSLLASLIVQAQLDSALPYAPRKDDSEGIGSYARKIAQAGLDLSANPRDVVYYHPMVSMAGLLPNPMQSKGS